MNKLVYLFELDSARNSEEEIKKAQKAMFEEIVLNGNVVVMTMNQLSDSLGFITAVNDNKTTQHILALFQTGVLRVSPFWHDGQTLIETPSQYLQIHIDEYLSKTENKFYFSGWLIEKNAFLCDIKSALQYNNPGLIGKNSENDEKNIKDVKTFVRMILQMGGDTLAINPAKESNSFRSMIHFLDVFMDKWDPGTAKDSTLSFSTKTVEDALSILGACKKIVNNDNNRSKWYKAIRESEGNVDSLKMAEAIIDLCYNYACEDSIWGISKHYTNDTNNNSFYEDFLNRLHLYWKDGENGTHKFLENGNKTDLNNCKPENWAHISKIMLYSHTPQERGHNEDNSSDQKKGGLDNLQLRSSEKTAESDSEEEYEKNIHQEKNKWTRRILFTISKIIVKTSIYILMFTIINMILNCLSKKSGFDNNGIIVSALSLIFFSLLSSIISLVARIPDILDLFIQFLFMLYFSAVFLFKKICRFHKGGSSYCRISNKKELNQ